MTDEELEAPQEAYADMEPEQVDAIESQYMAGIAGQRAVAGWDTVAARLKRAE